VKRLFAVMILLVLGGCATNPATKSSDFVLMSEKDELQLGQRMAAMVEKQMKLLPDSDPLAIYVNRVGQRVARTADRKDLFYRFHVVDDGTVNAFALPGGYIYIHRGLISYLNSEAELAAVLGHEIGHVTARHAVQRYTQAQGYRIGMTAVAIFTGVPTAAFNITDLLAAIAIQGYGREQELQADRLSLRYIARAGYDVHATTHLLRTLERLEKLNKKEKTDAGDKVEEYHGAFASHPETKKRIEETIAKEASIQNPAHAEIGHAELLNAINGYPVGDNPEEGAIIGQRFIHPVLGIQLEFPDNWVLNNTPQALEARMRKKDVYFRLSMKELQKRRTAEEVLKTLFPERRMGPVSHITVDGHPAARSLVMVSAPHISKAAVDATVWLDGPKAFIMLMWAKRDAYEPYLKTFATIRNSVRNYNKKRDGDVPRIHLYIWKRGDSWQRLAGAEDHVLGRFTADRLAILNGMDADKTPKPDTLIKIVH